MATNPFATPDFALDPEQSCLHCAVWGLIDARAPRTNDGAPIYNASEIVANLGEVIAEVIASHPREQRRRLIRQMAAELPQVVVKKVADGSHPKGGPAAPQSQ